MATLWTLTAFFSVASAQTFKTAKVVPTAGTPAQFVAADFNRDGRVDLAYQDAPSGGNLHILLSRGDGTFAAGQVIAIPAGVGSVMTAGDVNGDGIPDLVLGFDGYSSQVTLPPSFAVLLGRGDGTFTAPVYSVITHGYYPLQINTNIAIADITGDGNADLVYSDGFGDLYVAPGDGTGRFGAARLYQFQDFVGNITVVDLNGDGRPDVVFGGSYSIEVWLNQNGTLAKSGSYPSSYYSPQTGMFALADVNGDGHPDIVLTDEDSGPLTYLAGHGNGTFTAEVSLVSIPNHTASIIGVADLHGDGKPRIFVASADGVTAVLGATPSPTPMYAAGGNYFSQGVVADFNGDGYADVVMPGDGCILLLLGQADGTLLAAPSFPTNAYVGGLSLLDATGDGIPDAVLGPARVFAGKGDGTFASQPLTGNYAGDTFLQYVGNFDGNGRLGFYSYGGIQHNNGDGTFSSQYLSGILSSGFPSGYAAVADFNGDGRADVAVSTSRSDAYSPSTSGNTVTVAVSAGGGSLTYTSLAFGEPVGPLGAGDFDGDGCPDLAVGAATQIEIFKGDCHGNFQQIAAYATGTGATATGVVGGFYSSLEASDMAVADLDSDGHLDIVYTIPGKSIAKVLYGNGDGSFTASADIALPYVSLFVTAADLDSDNHPDLIFSGETIASVYHGTGTRTLSGPSLLAAGFATGKAQIADLNSDGNPDVVFPNLDFDGGDDSNDLGFTLALFVNPLPPRISDLLNVVISASPEPSTAGQSFMLKATFTPQTNPAIPSGQVTFALDGTSLGTATLDAAGNAQLSVASAAIGTHSISAVFPGNSTFAAATARGSHVVVGYTTSTTLTSSLNPSAAGQIVTFAANVAAQNSSNGIPVGSITFADGATPLATQPLDTSGDATYSTATFPQGKHTIIATFVPAGNFAGSAASVVQTVNGLPTTATLLITPSTLTYGSPIALNATVTSSSGGTLTGTVSFYDGSALVGTATLSHSSATYLLASPAAGSHSYTCVYSGDATYSSSICLPVPYTVSPAPSTLTLTSSANPSPALTPVSFTVAAASNSNPIPDAIITFTVDGRSSTATTGAGGTAAISVSLSAGAHTITAAFAGNTAYLSSSATLVESVTANPTATTLIAAPNPAVQNQPVTFVASIHPSIGTAQPYGTVVLYDGAAALGSMTVPTGQSNAAVTFTISTLASGAHMLTAVYTPADTNFTGSTSAPLTLVVAPADAVLSVDQSTLSIQTEHYSSLGVSLHSVGGLTGLFNLTCGTLPQWATCRFGQATLNLSANNTVSTTLEIDTDAVYHFRSALQPHSRPSGRSGQPIQSPLPLFALAPLALLFSQRRKARRGFHGILIRCAVLLSFFGIGWSLSGCGDKYPDHTAPGSYTVQVTATSVPGSTPIPLTRTTSFSLIVTH